MRIYRPKRGRGQILIITIVFFAIIAIISASLFTSVGNFIKSGSRSVLWEQATALADSGVERALWQLNTTAGAFYGDTSEVSLGQTGTSFVTITDKSPGVKTIVSTGYVGTSQNPRATRTVKVDAFADITQISFNYALQTGTGGLSMANSTTINGNVFSNGNISGSGSSIINGDAWAVGTISSPDPLVTGTKHPSSSVVDLPAIDYQKWKDAATVGEPESTNCSISTSTDIGPKKYDCNLTISNNATVTLNGPIYVTGNFSMSQGGTTLKLNEDFGSTATVVITDGTIDLTQGGTFVPTSANPKGYILLVTTSTVDPAISLTQSGSTAIFYALDGGAELSQSAHVVAVAAKKLTLKNSATLDYDFGLASSLFSTGPGASWAIKKGTYKFVANP